MDSKEKNKEENSSKSTLFIHDIAIEIVITIAFVQTIWSHEDFCDA